MEMGKVQVFWVGSGELQLQAYLQIQLYLQLQLELQSTWQWAGCRRFAVKQRTRQSGIFLLDFMSVVFFFLVASLLLFIFVFILTCLLLLCLCLCLCLLFCLLLCLALLLRFLSLTLFSFFLITTPFTLAAFLLEVKTCSIFFSDLTLSTLPSWQQGATLFVGFSSFIFGSKFFLSFCSKPSIPKTFGGRELRPKWFKIGAKGFRLVLKLVVARVTKVRIKSSLMKGKVHLLRLTQKECERSNDNGGLIYGRLYIYLL